MRPFKSSENVFFFFSDALYPATCVLNKCIILYNRHLPECPFSLINGIKSSENYLMCGQEDREGE